MTTSLFLTLPLLLLPSQPVGSAPSKGSHFSIRCQMEEEERVGYAEAIVLDGDVVLGALMMVHERENETLVCGDVMPQGGIQAVEAMLYTLDYVNREAIIPHVRLGAHILDDCDKDTYGLKQAVNFIKGYVCRFEGEEGEEEAAEVIHVPLFWWSRGSQDELQGLGKPITGVVAAASSVTSIQVANLLKLFQIPQISYFSTSPELSNQERFPYFFRTIPSDEYQTRAMRDIILRLNWTYVSVVYEESSYGKKAVEELERLLSEANVCIAIKARLPKDSNVARHQAYVDILAKLQSKANAVGVIVYGSDQEVHGLMRAVKAENATGQFTWIGSDGWSSRSLVYQDGHEQEVLGTISVQPKAGDITGFRRYFESLTVDGNARNPWFHEFWEHEFACRYPGYDETLYTRQYKRQCTGTESRASVGGYEFERQLQFVSDAVLAFAHAIANAVIAHCGADPSPDCALCFVGVPGDSNGACWEHLNGEELRRFLETVAFGGLADNDFRFSEGSHDPVPNYNIIHFRRPVDAPADAPPHWATVGSYSSQGLELRVSELAFYNHQGGAGDIPRSVCSEECRPDEVKKVTEGQHCCWVCYQCRALEIRSNDTHCAPCPLGTLPDVDKTACLPIPAEAVAIASLVHCWVCYQCRALEIRSNDTHCALCPLGTLPDADKAACLSIPAEAVAIASLVHCWVCYQCRALEIRSNDTHCAPFPLGTLPDVDKTACLSIPAEAVAIASLVHCWVCYQCRALEIRSNDTHCALCPLGTLPDVDKTRRGRCPCFVNSFVRYGMMKGVHNAECTGWFAA